MLYDDKQRAKFLNIMKALAISCVLLGHCEFTLPFLKELIYSFHMPAFFIVYGLAYNYNTHLEKGFLKKDFITQKLTRLIVPCFLWGGIYSQLTVKNIIYILYGNQVCFYNAGSLSSLWFLPCMFLGVCFFEGTMTLLNTIELKLKINNKFYFCFGILMSASIAAFAAQFLPDVIIGYPWSLNVAFMALVLIIIGYILKLCIMKYRFLKEGVPWIFCIIMIICLFVVLATFKENLQYISLGNVDMASGNYGNLLLFLVDGVGGTLFLLCIAVLLSKINITWLNGGLEYIGKNTLLVFVLHKPIIKLLEQLLLLLELRRWFLTVPICILTMFISIKLIIVIKRYIPILDGNSTS